MASGGHEWAGSTNDSSPFPSQVMPPEVGDLVAQPVFDCVWDGACCRLSVSVRGCVGGGGRHTACFSRHQVRSQEGPVTRPPP